VSNWFTRLFYVTQEEVKAQALVDSVDEVPRLLRKYPVVANPSDVFTITIDGHKSPQIRSLHDFLAAHAYVYAKCYEDRKDDPEGYSFVPLDAHKYPIWRVSYFELLKLHAGYYGLKLLKHNKKWIIARCYDCETCDRRLECLTEP
jgi:hypothetical protein